MQDPARREPRPQNLEQAKVQPPQQQQAVPNQQQVNVQQQQPVPQQPVAQPQYQQQAYQQPNPQQQYQQQQQQQQQQRQQPNLQVNNYNQAAQPQYKPVKVGEWIGTMILLSIPIVGFILLIVWAFGNKKPSKANWAKAKLLLALIISGIIIITFLLMFIITGASLNLNNLTIFNP